MARVCIKGMENLAGTPSLYLPNRVTAPALRELEQALGGKGKVAYLVEDVLTPARGLKGMLSRRGVLSFHFRNAKVKALREQLLDAMQSGRSIIFVPGIPNRPMGCLSDVPMPFMMQLAALHIAPVPVFIGFYRNDLWRTFCTDGTHHETVVRVLPKLTPGPLTGERVLEAWLEASAEELSARPILNQSVAYLLVKGLRKYAHSELIDGMDGSRLPFYKVLGVAMALARELKSKYNDRRLGILLPPGKGGVITNYACLLAGIVPVNINYTSSEPAFRSIVRQSGITHFVTARTFMSKLPQFPWPEEESLIHLDKTLKGIGMAKIAAWVAFAKVAPLPLIAAQFDLHARSGNDEAALLFTSGSSGEPKGVPLTHRMIVANLTQLLSRAYLPPGSRVLCSLPIFHSFGLSITTILPAVYGFSMVTYPSPLEAKKLNELIMEHEIALVVSTPTFARSMLRRASADTYKSVRYFMLGAEKLQKDIYDEFREKCGICVLEGYGLTETAPGCAANLDTAEPTEEQPYFVPGRRYGSVGPLFTGLAVRITDPDDDNVRLPLCEQGMLWFKGANVFNGYIGRDDLNAEILRDGWFKTGDLGKVDLNGFLTLGGRRSRFSKVAGEMVPHEVVEDVIEGSVQKPEDFAGRAVAVVGVPDAQKGEALVLLSCVHSSNLPHELDAIRANLVAAGLPRLWCPREIIPVEAIPVLPTGKLDLRGCQMLANEALGLN